MLVKTEVTSAKDGILMLRGADGAERPHSTGAFLIIAVGAQSNLEMVTLLEEVALKHRLH